MKALLMLGTTERALQVSSVPQFNKTVHNYNSKEKGDDNNSESEEQKKIGKI